MQIPFLALLVILVVAGCAPSSSALTFTPVTGAEAAASDAAAPLQVHEYPLVEQSKDNPNHLAFQQRVPEAIAAQRSGWNFRKPDEELAEYNRLLVPFDFSLRSSSSAPFSGYTLYHYDIPVQGGIARFWPVSLRQPSGGAGADFMLPFVTLSGEKLVASINGVHPWPDQTRGDAPAQARAQVAYAQTGQGQVGLFDGSAPLAETAASAPAPESIDPQQLHPSGANEDVFGMQVIDGQPLYFYTRGGITHVHYSDRELPYIYDQVVHDNSGDLAVYNPGSTGRVVWFYALRDGLWYYVEVGKFE